MYTAAVIGCGRAGFLYDLDPKRKEVFSHIGGYASSKKISKIYESYHHGSLSELCTFFTAQKPKGELVLIVEGRT